MGKVLNVHQSSSLEGSEIHTTDIQESSLFEVELAVEKLVNHKVPGLNKIPFELIQADGAKLYQEIYK